MPYITKYKLRHTLYRIEGHVLDDPIKRLLKDKLFFLSKTNREYIGVFLLFVKDPIKFIKTHYIEWKDTFTYIVENNPAFHFTLNCDRLNSDFENMFIPEKIRSAKLLKELRTFSKQNESLFSSNRKEFIERCIQHFNFSPYNLNLTPGDFKPVEKPNSGVVDYHDATIEEILEAIKELIKNIKNFLAVEENAIIARNLGDRLYLRDKSDIPRPLGLSIETVQNSLTQLNEFNKEFLTAATEYFQALFNPENEYDATILKVLNFKSCGRCYQNIDTSNLYDDQLINQYNQKKLENKDTQDYYELESLLTF